MEVKLKFASRSGMVFSRGTMGLCVNVHVRKLMYIYIYLSLRQCLVLLIRCLAHVPHTPPRTLSLRGNDRILTHVEFLVSF
jgi:hypothetical protein